MVGYYNFKITLTVALIVLISEVAKRSSLVGAILASIPIVSVLAMAWLYIETRDVEKISALSTSIFWLVIPSLSLFISLPILLRMNVNFYLSLTISVGITIFCYWLMVLILNRYEIML
jgi:hypothetical protein